LTCFLNRGYRRGLSTLRKCRAVTAQNEPKTNKGIDWKMYAPIHTTRRRAKAHSIRASPCQRAYSHHLTHHRIHEIKLQGTKEWSEQLRLQSQCQMIQPSGIDAEAEAAVSGRRLHLLAVKLLHGFSAGPRRGCSSRQGAKVGRAYRGCSCARGRAEPSR